MDFDELKQKAGELATEHADKIDQGLDKAAELADEKTGGEHTDKIDSAVDKAREVLGNLGSDPAP